MWLKPEYETEETEKNRKKQKKNIAKQTLGNGHTVGFKSFMKLHHCFLCIPTFSRVFFLSVTFWSTTSGKYCVKISSRNPIINFAIIISWLLLRRLKSVTQFNRLKCSNYWQKYPKLIFSITSSHKKYVLLWKIQRIS